MSPMPLPIRLAAGLAATALERARTLPQDAGQWPMSAVSQVLQISMRVQQRITELAIKGDEALAALREPEDEPPWAVFDEDLPRPTHPRPTANGQQPDGSADAEDPSWLDEVYEQARETAEPETAADPGPAALPGYPELTLASVRARLRVLTEDDLRELLDYERAHQDRAEFVRMLTNRIATVRAR